MVGTASRISEASQAAKDGVLRAVAVDPSVDIDALMAETVDPPNRYYRYPMADRVFLPIAMRTPVTPNQITALHAFIGCLCGYFIVRGTRADLVIAFVLAEARMIFDCLDGSVARAKKLYSPTGRTIDELGDTIGYLGMQLGAYLHMRARGVPWALPITLLGIASPAFMAVTYDFYRRKFGSALRENKDGIGEELLRKYVVRAQGKGSAVMSFGILFESIQTGLFAPKTLQEVRKQARLVSDSQTKVALAASSEIPAIRGAAHQAKFKRVLRFLAWVTGDNAITLFNFGLLVSVVWAEYIAIATGALMITAGALVCRMYVTSAVDNHNPKA
jgi:phosphatidylglycerophosphate synthase